MKSPFPDGSGICLLDTVAPCSLDQRIDYPILRRVDAVYFCYHQTYLEGGCFLQNERVHLYFRLDILASSEVLNPSDVGLGAGNLVDEVLENGGLEFVVLDNVALDVVALDVVVLDSGVSYVEVLHFPNVDVEVLHVETQVAHNHRMSEYLAVDELSVDIVVSLDKAHHRVKVTLDDE